MMSLPNYDRWLEAPYMVEYDEDDVCPHCDEWPCVDPAEAKAEARGWI